MLNLDAEHELETVGSYAPNRRLRSIVARQQARLFFELLAPGDFLLREKTCDGNSVAELELFRAPETGLEAADHSLERYRIDLTVANNLPGLAWSPTPRAVTQLRTVGARPRFVLDVEVLRTVNSRPFSAKLHDTLRGESFAKTVAHDWEQTLSLLSSASPMGWLVRRTFGAAGRGRRRIRSGKPDQGERDWIIASLRRGPLVIEPWARITREFTRSGWVAADGKIMISRPCFQETTPSGAWSQTAHAAPDELTRSHDNHLQEAFETAGHALAKAGYVGPFGIDAYLHRSSDTRREVLNPLSEINARFTMDWSYALRESAQPNTQSS